MVHKLNMKLLQSVQHAFDLVLLWQNGGPEVIGSRLLTESRSRDDADPGIFQQVEGVEDVGGLVGRFGGGDRLFGQVELKKTWSYYHHY